MTQLPTLIGFDFADLREGLAGKGPAIFGQAEASGENRAIRTAELALADIRRHPCKPRRP